MMMFETSEHVHVPKTGKRCCVFKDDDHNNSNNNNNNNNLILLLRAFHEMITRTLPENSLFVHSPMHVLDWQLNIHTGIDLDSIAVS